VSTKLHVRHLPAGKHRAEIDGQAAELADGSIGVIVPARSRAVVSVNVEWRRNGRAVGDEFRL